MTTSIVTTDCADVLLPDAVAAARVVFVGAGFTQPAARIIPTRAADHSGQLDQMSRGDCATVMISAARELGSEGTVVRLVDGDPGLCHDFADEALALRSAGVVFDVVPGISAAQGAAAEGGGEGHHAHAHRVEPLARRLEQTREREGDRRHRLLRIDLAGDRRSLKRRHSGACFGPGGWGRPSLPSSNPGRPRPRRRML